MDISVCAKILAGHDLLYASGDGYNSSVSDFQPDIKRYGGYYHWSSDRYVTSDLLHDDWVRRWKHFIV